MSWEDRLREAALTPPSGTRLTFTYEVVERYFEQKGGVFEFADADGSYPQPLGVTGRRYPMRLIFWGADYDLEADAFMDALSERGEFLLEHPTYGRLTVVPVGRVRQREDLVRRANETVIEVEFFDTIGVVYPLPTADVAGQQAELIDATNQQSAAQIAESETFDTVAGEQDFLGQYNATLDVVSAQLTAAAGEIEGAQKVVNNIKASINRGIDVLIKDPLALALQTQQLVQSIADFPSELGTRLTVYKSQLDFLTGTTSTSPSSVANNDLYATATAAGYSESALNTTYSNRTQAVAAAEEILAQLDTLSEWRDESYADIGTVDEGGSWQATQELLAFTAGALINKAFELADERVYVVAEPRTYIDLCFELYGTVDDKLDAIINDNDLSGDEMVELPRGREIIYYV